MKRTLTSALALLAAAAPAAAQDEDVLLLDEIVVFANQTETEANRTGATVEVITAEDLAETETTRVVDYLATLPGISVTSNGGIGTATVLRSRGLDGRYVAVRIDGIDVSDPSSTQTAYGFDSLLTEDVARIEVLKGSQSALYGSEAVAGVINITTFDPDQEGTSGSVSLEFGSYDTIKTGLRLSSGGERGALSFSLSHIDTDGFSAADENDGNREEDGHTSSRIGLNGAFDVSETVRLGFSAFYEDTETEFDQSGGPGGDGSSPFDQLSSLTSYGLRTYGEITGAVVNHTLSATLFEIEREFLSNGFISPFDGDRRELAYKGDYRSNENLRLVYGLDHTKESFETASDTGDTTVSGAFGEAQYAPTERLDIAMSARLDEHSDFGSFLSGRVALAYRPSDDWTLRAVLGNGFRAPSLFELNSDDFGNPDLDPEQSWSAELGAERRFANGGSVRATLFQTEIDDRIDFITLTSSPDPFTGEYQQIDGLTISRGVEVTAQLPLSNRFTAFGSYTYTDIFDQDGVRAARVPEHDLLIGVNAQLTDRLSGIVTAQRILGVVETESSNGETVTVDMPDYTVVNATMTYDLANETEAYLRVENLLDEEYQTSRGYGTSDRAVFLGLRASF